MRKAALILAFLVCSRVGVFCGQSLQIDMTTTPGLIEAILSKYFDVYCDNPEKLTDFTFDTIGQVARERFRRDGILRIIIMLPDGVSKTFDLDPRLIGGRVRKLTSISKDTSHVIFKTGESDLNITSTVYVGSIRPFTCQIWTLQPR